MIDIDLMQEYTGKQVPETMLERDLGVTYIYVPFVISETTEGYTWKYIKTLYAKYNYSNLVETLIGSKYSLSASLAIMFNYLNSPENEKYKTEFTELQEWRKKCKDFAKKHFNMV